jgi:hypothetical protein
MGYLRRKLSYANVVATIGLFIALGGSAYAIGQNSVGSKQIKPSAVKTSDLADDAVTAPKVADGSLLAEDFASGELPAGERGPIGPEGPKGETGPPGAPNPNAQTLDGKDSSEFLGLTAKAADAQLLDGVDSLNFTRLAGRVQADGTLPSGFSGYTVTKLSGAGAYFVSFPAGTFGSPCRQPIAMAIPTTTTLHFATLAGTQCSGDESGGFTVETYNSAGTQADASFAFMAR